MKSGLFILGLLLFCSEAWVEYGPQEPSGNTFYDQKKVLEPTSLPSSFSRPSSGGAPEMPIPLNAAKVERQIFKKSLHLTKKDCESVK